MARGHNDDRGGCSVRPSRRSRSPPFLIAALIALVLQGGDQPGGIWRTVRVGALGTMGLMFSFAAANLASDVATLT